LTTVSVVGIIGVMVSVVGITVVVMPVVVVGFTVVVMSVVGVGAIVIMLPVVNCLVDVIVVVVGNIIGGSSHELLRIGSSKRLKQSIKFLNYAYCSQTKIPYEY